MLVKSLACPSVTVPLLVSDSAPPCSVAPLAWAMPAPPLSLMMSPVIVPEFCRMFWPEIRLTVLPVPPAVTLPASLMSPRRSTLTRPSSVLSWPKLPISTVKPVLTRLIPVPAAIATEWATTSPLLYACPPASTVRAPVVLTWKPTSLLPLRWMSPPPLDVAQKLAKLSPTRLIAPVASAVVMKAETVPPLLVIAPLVVARIRLPVPVLTAPVSSILPSLPR